MSFLELDAWLSARAAADQFSGVVLIRCGERTVFSGAYGLASRRWAVPNTLVVRFDTASITKLFTSVAALQLVDEGRLDLDRPITEIVDLTGTSISSEVTVRHLLTHTSGIADDADEEVGESYAALWVDKPVYAVMRTRDFLPQFVDKPPNFPPGEGCRYCNAGGGDGQNDDDCRGDSVARCSEPALSLWSGFIALVDRQAGSVDDQAEGGALVDCRL